VVSYELAVTDSELGPGLSVRGVQVGSLPEADDGRFDSRARRAGHARRFITIKTLQVVFVRLRISRGTPRQAVLPPAVEMETELSRHLAGHFVLDIENVDEGHVKRLGPEGYAFGSLHQIQTHADAVARHLQTPVQDGIYLELSPCPKRVRAGFHVLTDRARRPDGKTGNLAHSSNNAVCDPQLQVFAIDAAR